MPDIEGIVFNQPLHNPITPDHLHALCSKLNLNLPHDTAFWAIAVIAFWGCRHLGELTMKSSQVFNPSQNVSQATSISHSIVNRCRVISFHLPWTKTMGVNGGNCIITETGDDLCPVWALNNHLVINALPDHIAANLTALFAYWLNNNSFYPTIKKNFISFTSAIYTFKGLNQTSGHSYRIGGTLKLLLDGVPPEMVMKVSGWSSLCFFIYW